MADIPGVKIVTDGSVVIRNVPVAVSAFHQNAVVSLHGNIYDDTPFAAYLRRVLDIADEPIEDEA